MAAKAAIGLKGLSGNVKSSSRLGLNCVSYF